MFPLKSLEKGDETPYSFVMASKSVEALWIPARALHVEVMEKGWPNIQMRTCHAPDPCDKKPEMFAKGLEILNAF